jgi:hypothetical protein
VLEKFGFVYIWYDRKRKRFYIGSHWGTEDDGYICSSNWMRDAYRKRPTDFKRKIISRVKTNRKDLLIEEYRWLQMIKDKEIKIRYYNLRKHLNDHWSADPNKHKTVIEKVAATKRAQNAAMTPEERRAKFGHWKGKTGANKGKLLTADQKDKLRQANLGKKHSDETIQKMSGKTPWNKNKSGYLSDEAKKKMAWMTGKKLGPRSDEIKLKIAVKNKLNTKKLWEDDEYRRKNVESRKGKRWFKNLETGETKQYLPGLEPTGYVPGRI